MTRFYSLFFALLMSTALLAQSPPQSFSYQTVIRDAGFNIMANQEVVLRLSIVEDGPQGVMVYQEKHVETTSAIGLVNLFIGEGNISSGSFEDIDWANYTYFLQVEIDFDIDDTFIIMGTSQLRSVPYALYALNAGNTDEGSVGPQGEQGEQGIQGEIGAQGLPGTNGIDGADGQDGTNGTNGLPGADGTNGNDGAQGPIGDTGLQGIQGIQGETGEQGLPGFPGINGQDGSNGLNGNDGTQGVQGETGAQGPIGDTGLQGIQGIQGETGEQGLPGFPGINGQDGSDGVDGITGQSAYAVWISLGNTGNEADFISSLTGPQGNNGVVDYDSLANIISVDSTFITNFGGNMVFGDRIPITLDWNSRTNNYYYSIGQATIDYVAPTDGFICGTAFLGNLLGASPGSFIKFHRDTIANPLIVAGEMSAFSYANKSTFMFDIKEGETYRFSRQEVQNSLPGNYGGNIESCFFLPISSGGGSSSTTSNATIDSLIQVVSNLDSALTALTSLLIVEGCTDPSQTNYNPNANFDDGSCIPFTGAIGDSYQGGIVFWLDGNGGGLIAADSDQSTSAGWGCAGTSVPGAYGTVVGIGQQNTNAILTVCTTVYPFSQPNTAADICANLTHNGYSDWFLPSVDELIQIYLNIGQGNALGLGNIGGFAIDNYWSSSESSFSGARSRHFGNGTQNNTNKGNNIYVRAVRAF